jgi:hypothetical protein
LSNGCCVGSDSQDGGTREKCELHGGGGCRMILVLNGCSEK